MIQQFSTRVVNPASLSKWRFIIPSYQRPFVWQEEQINRLLLDFHQAYLREDDQYFIGTVLTSEHPEHMYELIDGQQRITMLWLLAMAFRLLGEDTKITSFLKREDELRIDFAIRKQLKSYLLSLMDRKKNDRHQYSDHEVEEDPYLVNVAKALTTITKKLETLSFKDQKNLAGLGDYIFQSVYLVLNTAPPLTNLNKLFATMNSAGVQLEQADILKSKLLKAVAAGGDSDERLLYDKIWTACAGMNNYFERNVRQLFPETNWRELEPEHFSEFSSTTFRYKKDANSQINKSGGHLLSKIIGDTPEETKSSDFQDEAVKANDEVEIIYCRPIINFSQLLLHTYRIFLLEQGKEDFEPPFHVKNLLEIFKSLPEESSKTVKAFFHCLWRVRYVFDKEVAKWVVDEDKEENLTLTSVNKHDRDETRYFNRSPIERMEGSLMLQSVRYFTGNYNTQIWLTPFLHRLLLSESTLASLEDIDNRLSLLPDKEDKQTTWELIKYPIQPKGNFDIQAYLRGAHGTRFRHYWFQKLEYILWKYWDGEKNDKFNKFRITSKNSVEHVYPQNPEYGDRLPDEVMDAFGNLALLNVSQNSSYSHQDVKKKKTDFENKSSYDSLKLAKIYALIDYKADKPWQRNLIEKHQEEMIDLINQHYQKT